MGNTPEGARKAAETTRKRYGKAFMKARAKKAAASRTAPAFTDPELAARASKKGLAKRWKNSTGG